MNASQLARQLSKLTPVFTARPEQIKFLASPGEFYEHIKSSIRTAKRRVSMASLYLGTDDLEHQLVSLLNDKLAQEKGAQFRAHIHMDYLRGTRGFPGASSAGLLLPLVTAHNNLLVSMYLTPSYWHRMVPPRWNEIFGLSHMKVCVFDDDVLVSGANFSKSYFENRADRYVCVSGNTKLAEYFDGLLKTVSRFSPTLKGLTENGFRFELPSISADSIQKEVNQFIDDQAKLSDPIGDGGSFLLPSIQMGPHGIRQDEKLLESLLNWTNENVPSSKMFLATGYFNLSPLAQHIFSQCRKISTPWKILTSSPEANGFFQSEGLSKYIPDTYRAIELQFLEGKDSRPNLAIDEQGEESICEYKRPGWTFHAKGLWTDSPSDFISTVIGSSNFGHRSFDRDLEAQLTIITDDKDLTEKIRIDRDSLYKYSELISASTIKKTGHPLISKIAAKAIKSYL